MPVGPHAADWSRSGVPCRYGCLVAADAKSLAKRASKRGVRRMDLEQLIAITGGVCMVCRHCHATVVEHCHNTGRVRGIACSDCNTRIGHLEGTAYWPPVHVGGCSCQGRRSDDQLLRWLWDLEQATYRFLDHAMEPVAHDRKDAFGWLVAHPYPTVHPVIYRPAAVLPRRTREYAREVERMRAEAALVAYRQQQRMAGQPVELLSEWEQRVLRRLASDVRGLTGEA